MEPGVVMATQNFKRNLLLILYKEGKKKNLTLAVYFLCLGDPTLPACYPLPGSSPSGSRVIRRGDGIGVLGKNFFNYKYRERLEMDSIVGNISGEKEAE